MLEKDFQASLISEIKTRLPKSIVLKNDPDYIQGIPDLLVLNNKRWAALECKKNGKAKKQPNQKYYVEKMDAMSYAAFVYPENKEQILDELQQALQPHRKTRSSRSE